MIFTPEEVESINGFQKAGVMHPFTCDNCRTTLLATVDGLICPKDGCKYRQLWCHHFMRNNEWKKLQEAVLGIKPKPQDTQ